MDLAERYGITDDTTWYLAQARGEKAGPRLVGLCRLMASEQSILRTNTEKCMAIFQWGGAAKDTMPGEHVPIEENVLSYNAAKNAVETVHAKVTKARIAPMPLTTGGGYLARHRAKQMGKAIEGVLTANDVDAIEKDVVLDALTTDHGAGAVKVIECHDEVKIQHVPIEDVWFDEAEVRQRQPRSCYHVPRDGVDKYVAIEDFARENDTYPGLAGTWEERRQAILSAASKPEAWRIHAKSVAQRVDIFEAWHLPSGKVEDVDEEYDEEYEDEVTGAPMTRTATRKVRKHDGRHVVAVDGPNGTLIDEPWDGEGGFPILLYVPRKRRRHILGMSLMRDLIAPQREYEKLTAKTQSMHQKAGISGFSVRRGDEVDTREITTGTLAGGFFVETNDQPPIPLVNEPVPVQQYAYMDSIPRNMLERNGISTMAANSQVPAGMSQASGKALQVFEDFEDVRLSAYHQERESFKVKLSWLIVHAARRIVERCGGYKANYQSKKGIEAIDWKDVLLDKGAFTLRVFPVSELSKQPAAKFAQLSELMDRGALTIEQFKRLFELPDLEAENELDSSATDIVDRTLDKMVIENRYIAVEPFDNFDLIIQRAGKFYDLCRINDVPDARLKLIRDYISDARSKKEEIAAEAARKASMNVGPGPYAPPPPPMGGPPGMAPPEGPLPGMPPMPLQPPPDAAMPPPMPMAA